MKKIISFCLVIATVCLIALSLVGCKKDDGVPEGMQIVRAGSEYGYNLYAPEEWTVSNHGDVACVYVSKLDSTSVTFVKADAPVGDAEASVKDKTMAYFDADMAKFPFAITAGIKGEATAFGNATDAYKFTYSYKYGEATIGVMQISFTTVRTSISLPTPPRSARRRRARATTTTTSRRSAPLSPISGLSKRTASHRHPSTSPTARATSLYPTRQSAALQCMSPRHTRLIIPPELSA